MPRPRRSSGSPRADLETVLARTGARVVPAGDRGADGGLYGADARVRRMVDEAREGLAEVRLWGEGWPGELDGAARPVRYRLGVAAAGVQGPGPGRRRHPGEGSEETEDSGARPGPRSGPT